MDGTCAMCGGHYGMMYGMYGHGMNAISGTIQSDTDPEIAFIPCPYIPYIIP